MAKVQAALHFATRTYWVFIGIQILYIHKNKNNQIYLTATTVGRTCCLGILPHLRACYNDCQPTGKISIFYQDDPLYLTSDL
jgi:hypothetical protein